MKHIEKWNWHDVIIEDKKGTDIENAQSIINWYIEVMLKIKKDEIISM